MLTEIENAIIDRLETGGLSVRDIDIQKGAKGLIYPAIFVSTEAGDFKNLSQVKFKCSVTVSVIAVFKSHKSEKKRRHGVYPILSGVLLRLMLQDLGLNITPLFPVRFRNVTDRRLAEKALMAYQLDFRTSFELTRVDDETSVDLLEVGLKYYLQEPVDDGEADAGDELTFTP